MAGEEELQSFRRGAAHRLRRPPGVQAVTATRNRTQRRSDPPRNLRGQRDRVFDRWQNRIFDGAFVRRHRSPLHLVTLRAYPSAALVEPREHGPATVWTWKIAPIAGSSVQPRWIVSRPTLRRHARRSQHRDVTGAIAPLSIPLRSRPRPASTRREKLPRSRIHPRDAAKRRTPRSPRPRPAVRPQHQCHQRRTRRVRRRGCSGREDDRQRAR